MIGLFFTYLKCFFYWFFKVNSPERDAFVSLYRKHTFRVPLNLKNDRLVGFRFFKNTILALNRTNGNLISTGQVLIFDGDVNQKKQRLAYLNEIYKNEKKDYIALDELPGVSLIYATVFLIIMFPLFFILSIISCFSGNRASIALSILSITQNFLLLRLTKRNNVKKIYYFFSYENDANFNSLILINNNIEVINIPGPNPLQRFHTHTVASKIALCAGFQFEQAEVLKKKWFIQDIIKWPLYGFQEFINYRNNNVGNYEYPIGLISSGVWRRLELGLQSLENDYESEQELIVWLKGYLEISHSKKLFIFLHPIEKKTLEVYTNAIVFYKHVFNGINIEFSDFTASSYKDFSKVNIAVSSHSTTNLQRLFCGYKVFYTPMKYLQPLFPNTSIDSICITQKQHLYTALDDCLKISDNQFFDKYNLWNYHYKKVNELV
jgi:hypothetical protein